MTTTPSHHSVVHQTCLLKGQAIGMSRGFYGREFTNRRGIIVTHLNPGSQRKIITVFVFYIQGKITEC